MARIQSKRSGRKRPPEWVTIRSREINRLAEESLVNRGAGSKKWGEYGGKRRSAE